MKTMRFILVFNIFVAVFYSCSTDVDLYAEYMACSRRVHKSKRTVGCRVGP